MAVVSINYPSIADCEAAPGAAGFDVGSTAIIGTGTFTLEVSSASIDHTSVLDAKIGGVRWLISANPASAMTSLTGDVTATGPGAAAATVVNLPTGATMAAKLTATAVVAPATPASGKGAIYVDSTSKNLAVKDDAGVVKHGVQTATTASSVVTAISDAGAVTVIPMSEMAPAGTWYQAQAAFLLSKIPELTEFGFQKLGQYNLGSIATATGFANSAAMEGGGESAGAGVYTCLGSDIYQNCNAGKFGIVFRGILAVTITAKSASLGLISSGAAHQLAVRSNFDTDATHYLFAVAGTEHVTTVVNDGLIHDFAITGDGTNVKLWIDGVLADTEASSGVAIEPLGVYIQNTTAGNAKSSKFLYGYIAP